VVLCFAVCFVELVCLMALLGYRLFEICAVIAFFDGFWVDFYFVVR